MLETCTERDLEPEAKLVSAENYNLYRNVLTVHF